MLVFSCSNSDVWIVVAAVVITAIFAYCIINAPYDNGSQR